MLLAIEILWTKRRPIGIRAPHEDCRHRSIHTRGSRIDGLAFVRVYTEEGLKSLSDIFSVPPVVTRAVIDGPDSLFDRLLINEDPIHPAQLWTKLYNSMLHGNRRGWAIICLEAVDVALWNIFGQELNRPVWQLLGGVERAHYQITDSI